jgi:hypothetical protein
MHLLDVMNHVVLGLPQNVQDRINPTEVKDLNTLVSTIIQLEKPFVRKSNFNSNNSSSGNSSSNNFSAPAYSSLRRRTLCGYCKSKGFERFHPEADCFTKFKDQRDKTNVSRSNNNNNSNVKSTSVHTFDMSSLEEAINKEVKN